MISVAKMQALEKEAGEKGITTLQLMENAGANCAKILDEENPLKNKNIIVFCGTGNNGGDGFCFARHAKSLGAEVSVFLVKKSSEIRTDDAKRNFKIIKNYGLEIFEEKIPEHIFQKADIIVDALLGTGAKGAPKEPYKSAIDKINSSDAFTMSIDVPSGVDADTGERLGVAVKPNLTICLHDIKTGLKEDVCGKMRIAPLGLLHDC
ncbi:MAG: NAD(P)H-hydrate epimerase [Candidatus Aenigmarchaeota archaeon]|nr:NAD(P)H-hydrate epimerase [Candidatus Aenigmarchaeota archaeon]